jgi:hypothetical protein
MAFSYAETNLALDRWDWHYRPQQVKWREAILTIDFIGADGFEPGGQSKTERKIIFKLERRQSQYHENRLVS